MLQDRLSGMRHAKESCLCHPVPLHQHCCWGADWSRHDCLASQHSARPSYLWLLLGSWCWLQGRHCNSDRWASLPLQSNLSLHSRSLQRCFWALWTTIAPTLPYCYQPSRRLYWAMSLAWLLGLASKQHLTLHAVMQTTPCPISSLWSHRLWWV